MNPKSMSASTARPGLEIKNERDKTVSLVLNTDVMTFSLKDCLVNLLERIQKEGLQWRCRPSKDILYLNHIKDFLRTG